MPFEKTFNKFAPKITGQKKLIMAPQEAPNTAYYVSRSRPNSAPAAISKESVGKGFATVKSHYRNQEQRCNISAA